MLRCCLLAIVALTEQVSTKEVKQFGEGDKLILVVDCGMKYNQIRSFLKRGVRVKIVPYDYDFANEQYDGLFLTNGPGDPTMCSRTIENLKRVLAARPAKPVLLHSPRYVALLTRH